MQKSLFSFKTLSAIIIILLTWRDNISLCDTNADLRADKLENYDPKVPPSAGKGPVTVQIGLILTHFTLEETGNTFQANVWLNLNWVDKRLSWNRTSTKDAMYLRFSHHEIWQPDLELINNAMPTDTFSYGESLLTVDSDGKVVWTPSARFISHCSMNMIRWPNDEHTCYLHIASWTSSRREIDLELGPKGESSSQHQGVDSQLFIPNGEWSLISTDAEKDDEFYAFSDNPYAVVKYSFLIKRKSPLYTATLIVPIFMVSLVNVFVFMLPPTAGEKITLGSINFLIVSIFLSYFEARLPALGDHLPLLVLLYAINCVLIGISLIISVLVINISRTRKPSSPPQCFKMFCNANFAQFLGLGYIVPYISQTHSRLDEGVEMQPARDNGGPSSFGVDKDEQTTNLVLEQDPPYLFNAEWILLASMIDRLTLIVYTIVSGITLGLCLA